MDHSASPSFNFWRKQSQFYQPLFYPSTSFSHYRTQSTCNNHFDPQILSIQESQFVSNVTIEELETTMNEFVMSKQLTTIIDLIPKKSLVENQQQNDLDKSSEVSLDNQSTKQLVKKYRKYKTRSSSHKYFKSTQNITKYNSESRFWFRKTKARTVSENGKTHFTNNYNKENHNIKKIRNYQGKCKGRFGPDNRARWCKSCKQKHKCTRF